MNKLWQKQIFAIIFLCPCKERSVKPNYPETLFFYKRRLCGAFFRVADIMGHWRSWEARHTGSVEVTGSNPVCSNRILYCGLVRYKKDGR